ncbi:MAG TPA: 7-cyano-7-deazaguanine synthase [Pirellulales bacterium]|nr:7-cyano-7-deazaguanine synthase [Pirellulales bacterium]
MASTVPRAGVGVLVSGGLDSSILLAHYVERGRRVQPFYVRSGLAWQTAELAALRRFLAAIADDRLEELVTLDLPLADLYGEHWSVSGRDVPDAESDDEAVYLPGRNALLIIKAALWCHLNGIKELALGPLRANPFADATPEFFAAFQSSLNLATGGGLRLVRPLAGYDKRQVMQLGRHYPLELTFSCISPRGSLHCGECNKCGERRRAFQHVGLPDPTRYPGGKLCRSMRG